MIVLPNMSRNVEVMLSSTLETEQSTNWHYFFKAANSIKFLAMQGISWQGDGDKVDINLMQLLYLHEAVGPQMFSCLLQRSKTFISLQIQNDLLKIMVVQILMKMLHPSKRPNAILSWLLKLLISPIKSKFFLIICCDLLPPSDPSFLLFNINTG